MTLFTSLNKVHEEHQNILRTRHLVRHLWMHLPKEISSGRAFLSLTLFLEAENTVCAQRQLSQWKSQTNGLQYNAVQKGLVWQQSRTQPSTLEGRQRGFPVKRGTCWALKIMKTYFAGKRDGEGSRGSERGDPRRKHGGRRPLGRCSARVFISNTLLQ